MGYEVRKIKYKSSLFILPCTPPNCRILFKYFYVEALMSQITGGRERRNTGANDSYTFHVISKCISIIVINPILFNAFVIKYFGILK